MTEINDEFLSRVKSNLRCSIQELNLRGLRNSSKWASEQLFGLSDSTDTSIQLVQTERHTNPEQFDLIMFCDSLILSEEFNRCAHVLRTKVFRESNSDLIQSETYRCQNCGQDYFTNILIFLNIYSSYMAGEKLKDQCRSEFKEENKAGKPLPSSNTSVFSSTSSHPEIRNPNINELFKEFFNLYCIEYFSFHGFTNESPGNSGVNPETWTVMDGFHLYLFGVVLKEMRNQGTGNYIDMTAKVFSEVRDKTGTTSNVSDRLDIPSAMSILVESLRRYPWNW